METEYIKKLKMKKKEIEETLKKESKVKVTKKGKLNFYRFNQNNSGGSFVVDNKVCHNVILEAHNFKEAREKAKELGIYFDGVSLGIDCSCCGDRWHDYENEPINYKKHKWKVNLYADTNKKDKDIEKKWYELYGDYEIIEKPTWKKDLFREFEGKIKFNSFDEYWQFEVDEYGWTAPDIRVYFYNGKVKEFFKKKEKFK